MFSTVINNPFVHGAEDAKDDLIDTTGVPLSAFHVCGHSAGAHMAGAVGLGYRERHNFTKLLPRITGLDPGNYITDLINF